MSCPGPRGIRPHAVRSVWRRVSEPLPGVWFASMVPQCRRRTGAGAACGEFWCNLVVMPESAFPEPAAFL